MLGVCQNRGEREGNGIAGEERRVGRTFGESSGQSEACCKDGLSRWDDHIG